MRMQRVARIDGVRERDMRWAGATPVLRTSCVGYAALVAPALGIPSIQNISGADIRLICAGYKADWFSIGG